MTHSRWTPITFSLVAIVGLGLGSLFSAPSAHADEIDPCTAKKFELKQVEQACKTGGRKAAKDLMKAAVKKSKEGGKDGVKCNDCHTSLKTFELKPDAVAMLKPLL